MKRISITLLLIAATLVGQSGAWATALPVTGAGFIAYGETNSGLSLVAPGYLIGVGASVFTLVQNFDGIDLPATLFTNFSGFIDDGVGSVTTPDAIYPVTSATGQNCVRNCVGGGFSLTSPGIFLTPLTTGPASGFAPVLTADLPVHLDLFLSFQKDLFTDHATFFSQEFTGDGTWTIEIDGHCDPSDPRRPCLAGGQFRWVSQRLVFAPVPEPATWLLLGSGLVGLVLWRRKRTA